MLVVCAINKIYLVPSVSSVPFARLFSVAQHNLDMNDIPMQAIFRFLSTSIKRHTQRPSASVNWNIIRLPQFEEELYCIGSSKMKKNLLRTVLCAMALCHRILSFSVTSFRTVRSSDHFNCPQRLHTNCQRHNFGSNHFPSSSITQVRGSILDDFTTADGDIINPYSVLNISRRATRREVREAYRCLCKQYHPDRAKFLCNLPGEWYVYWFLICF